MNTLVKTALRFPQNKWKRTLGAMVALTLGMGAAKAETLTWNCGYCEPIWDCTPTSAVTATLSGGVLTIRGTGAMFDAWTGNPLWYSYRNYITSAVINNGVTTISGYAFQDCSNLTSISIPNSVMEIGFRAILFTSALTSISIPSSVTKID